MALSRASAPTSSDHPWKYDVFLSFRGEDTRKNFTDHLYDKLKTKAIKTFRDNLELEREAFIKHEKNFREDLAKVQHWGAALTKVGDIAGWTSKDRYETELIKEIVEAVWNKAYPRFIWLCQTEMLIGIGMTLEQLDLLLDTEANDVHFIGTWSMGRIGKTTIARLVYERISHNCEVSSFLGNAREVLCNTWSPPSTKTASFHSLQGKVYTSLGRL